MPVLVDFATSVQPLEALQAAAYRLIGTASCHIDERDGRYLCTLRPAEVPQAGLSDEDLRARFLGLVVDETLRHRLYGQTEGVRNLILALAFGGLADNAAAPSGE